MKGISLLLVRVILTVFLGRIAVAVDCEPASCAPPCECLEDMCACP